jgi:ferredoxin
MRRAALVLCVALAGCGGQAPDLFEVKRSGTDRNANLTLLVSDGGSVTCNGHEHPISNERLLEARQLARDLAAQAELNLALPPGPAPVLSYRVRVAEGEVSFADTSRPLPQSFAKLTAFTADVSERVCGLSRD